MLRIDIAANVECEQVVWDPCAFLLRDSLASLLCRTVRVDAIRRENSQPFDDK